MVGTPSCIPVPTSVRELPVAIWRWLFSRVWRIFFICCFAFVVVFLSFVWISGLARSSLFFSLWVCC